MTNSKEMNFNFVNCAWTNDVDKIDAGFACFFVLWFFSVQVFPRSNVEKRNKILDGNGK